MQDSFRILKYLIYKTQNKKHDLIFQSINYFILLLFLLRHTQNGLLVILCLLNHLLF